MASGQGSLENARLKKFFSTNVFTAGCFNAYNKYTIVTSPEGEYFCF